MHGLSCLALLAGIIMALALVAPAHAALSLTQEDIVSAPATSFIGIGTHRSGGLVHVAGTCAAHLVAGAEEDNSEAGSVHHFARASQTLWDAAGVVLPAYTGAGAADEYGHAVATHVMDGGAILAAVGAPGAPSGGHVEVFKYDNASNGWLQIAGITAGSLGLPLTNHEFGHDVSLSSTHLAVGMPGGGVGESGMVVLAWSAASESFSVVKFCRMATPGRAAGSTVDVFGSWAVAGMPLPLTGAGGALLADLTTPALTVCPETNVAVGTDDGEAAAGARCGHAVLATENPVRVMLGCPFDDRVLGLAPEDDPMTVSSTQDIGISQSVIGPAMFGAALARGPPASDGKAKLLIGAPLHNESVGIVAVAEATDVLGTDVYLVTDHLFSPTEEKAEFGSDIAHSGDYWAVGAPVSLLASTPAARRAQLARSGACAAYELGFAGETAGSAVTTRSVAPAAGAPAGSPTVGVTFATDRPGDYPLVYFDSGNPHSAARDLGTPNFVYGGPGVGLGGFLSAHKNKVALGNVVVLQNNAAPTSNPNVHVFGGRINVTFSEPVDMHSITLLDGEWDYAAVRFYGAGGAYLGKTWVPFGGSNSAIELATEYAGVTLIKLRLFGRGAIARMSFSVCDGGATGSGSTGSGSGSGSGSTGSGGGSGSGSTGGGGSTDPPSNGGTGESGHYYIYRNGPADASCDPAPPVADGSVSPAAALSSFSAFLF